MLSIKNKPISFLNYSLEIPILFENKNDIIDSNYYIQGEKLWSEIWTGYQEYTSLVNINKIRDSCHSLSVLPATL